MGKGIPGTGYPGGADAEKLKLYKRMPQVMTIGKQITLGFASVLAVLALMCGLSHSHIQSITAHSKFLSADALPGLQLIGDFLNFAQENYVNTLKGVLSDDPKEKEEFAAAIAANIVKINDLTNKYSATISLDKDRELFGKVIQARAAYVTAFKAVEALSSAGKNKEAYVVIHDQLQPAYDHLEHAIEELVDFNKENASAASGAIAIEAASSEKTMYVGAGVALLLGIGVTFFVTRRVNRSLSQTAVSLEANAAQTSSAAGQLASTSQELAAGASQQAASLEETSAALEEINSMVNRNAESANRAKSLTTETRQAADASATRLKNLGEAMEAIQTSSSSIAKIIKSIDEIAFQTNILALNAAVEAARAGEAGAGFSVVADEVRNLAQRAALAARETAEKIEDALAKTTQGVQASNQLGENLTTIIEKARSVDDLVGEIAQASKEQADGIGQVNSAVVQMDRVTQANAASAEESASASQELSAQSDSLQDAVAELLALIGRSMQRNKSTSVPPGASRSASAAPVSSPTVQKPAATKAQTSTSHAAEPAEAVRQNEPATNIDHFKSF